MLKLHLDSHPRIKTRLDTPIRVVVCGEIRSGKSTVINTLLRENVLPNFLGESWRPAVLVRHSEVAGKFVQYFDGTQIEVTSLQNVPRFDEVAQFIVQTSQPHLKGFELIELPFFQDGDVTDETLDFMATADIMIWTTIASQAWRLTEKTVIQRLDDKRPAHAIIAVTRADKLRSAADCERVGQRVTQETEAYFAHAVFIHGASRQIEDSTSSDRAWEDTSGRALFQILSDCSDEIRAAQTEVAEPAAVPEPAPQPRVSEGAEILTLDQFRHNRSEPVKAAPAEPYFDAQRFSPIRSIVETFYGVVAAGIVTGEGARRIFSLCGDDKSVRDMAEFCVTGLRETRRHYDQIGQSGDIASAQVIMQDHLIAYQVFDDGNLLFMLCKNSKMNPGIARTAFIRLCQTYNTLT